MNDSDPIIENRRHTDRSRRRTRILFGVATLLIASGVVGGVSLYHRYYGTPKRFAVVDDRILYRSAQPKPAQITHVIDDLGIRTIVIAREGTSRNVPDEVKIGEQHGARVVNIPVESRRPIPDSQIEAFFQIVDDPAQQPVLVHCSAGRHRTGLLCALYRIERQGWTVERAMEEMLSFGFNQDSQSAVYLQLKAYKPGQFQRRLGSTTKQVQP